MAEGWELSAACRKLGETEIFFPSRGESCELAKSICKGCPVREDCLEHALANGEKFGIWGGYSERDRRKMRRRRNPRQGNGNHPIGCPCPFCHTP